VHWLALNPALLPENLYKNHVKLAGCDVKVTDSFHVTMGQFSFSFEHFNKSNGERVPCDDDEEGQRGLLYLSRIVFSVLGKQFR
jgi:hypothetical protein